MILVEGHMVVDKTNFQSMVTQKIALEVNKHKGEIAEKNMKFVEDLKGQAAKLFSEEREKIQSSLKQMIVSQQQHTQQVIQKILESETDLPTIRTQIQQVLEQQKNVLDNLLYGEISLSFERLSLSPQEDNQPTSQDQSNQ